MAKCVRVDGKIQRVSDSRAEELVKAGASYCSKSEWKESRPKPKKEKEKKKD